MKTQWPVLSYEKGKKTYETLHMFTQIVGKIKLATMPWVNHSWHITFHITSSGLTTQTMPYKEGNFQVDFDFVSHSLKIFKSDGGFREMSLLEISVADFYETIFDLLRELNIELTIKPVPVEMPNPVPFKENTTKNNYDPGVAASFQEALLSIQDTFMIFRGIFKGKSSPIHFFWGSFDLALSFFSGNEAPPHPGGIPGLPNWVAEEAYCREVSSCGFWTGSEGLQEAAFYCYLYPEPDGYKDVKIKPNEAYYHPTLKEFILPYAAVQKADDPQKKLLEFLNSTYNAGADIAKWNREILEQ